MGAQTAKWVDRWQSHLFFSNGKHAFPIQAAHPGWTLPRRSRPEDDASVERALVRAGSTGRVFFGVPPSNRRELSPLLTGRGVTRRIVETPELVLLVWSPK